MANKYQNGGIGTEFQDFIQQSEIGLSECPLQSQISPEQLSGITSPETISPAPVAAPIPEPIAPQAPVLPSAAPVEPKTPDEYQKLLKQYDEASKGKNKAKKLQALLSGVKAIADASSQFVAGAASAAGGFEVKPGKGMEVPTVEQLYQGPDLDALKGKLNLLKSIKSGKLSEKDKFYMDIAKKNYKLGLDRLEHQKEQEDRRLKKFKFDVGEKGKDRAEKVVNEFNKDATTKDIVKGLVAADKADEVIERGGKLAPSVMGRLLARLAGEVGVMTDKDVEAFRGSQKYTDALNRYFTRTMISGKLTEDDKKTMKQMVKNLRDVNQQHLQKRATVIGTQFATVNNVPVEDMMRYVQPGVTQYIKPQKRQPQVNEKIMRDPKSGRNVIVDATTNKVLRWAD